MSDPRRKNRGAALFLLLFAAAALAPGVASAQQPAEAKVEFRLPFATGEVYPLFKPDGRSLWDQEWEIEILEEMGPGRMGAGTRFYPKSDPETIWQVAAVDEEANRIEYTYAKPGVYDISLRIECEVVKARSTLVRVSYLAIGKSETIAESLSIQLNQQIEQMVLGPEGWRDRMLYFLQQGKRWDVFAPVAIEREHEFRLDADPDRAFAVANPAGGNHWSAGTPEYVFGGPDEPAGSVWRRGDNWFAVGEYDPDRRVITTILSMPQTEFLLETLHFDAHPDGGTRVRVIWRVAGVSADGNDAVQTFFAGHWDERMARLEASYRERLAP